MKSTHISHIIKLVFQLVIGIGLLSCQRKEVDNYSSASFPFDTITNIPNNNQLTAERIALGKKLFFDKNLSSNQSISCASCHLPEKAFTDGTALASIGVSGKTLDRNAPPLFNLIFQNDFFWDGGKATLESQVFGPLRNADEMNANIDSVVNYLIQDTEYSKLFQKAYKNQPNASFLAKAIATYERSLMSFNSKYDRVKRGKDHFSPNELSGEKIFNNKCKSCHTPPLFTDMKFHNNGLDTTFGSYFDNPLNGRYRVSGNIEDLGKYKTPSLRNLAYTSPYMHDGRLEKITDVLDHYDMVKKSESLDTLLTFGIELTEKNKADLIAFLNTLNDENFVNEN